MAQLSETVTNINKPFNIAIRQYDNGDGNGNIVRGYPLDIREVQQSLKDVDAIKARLYVGEMIYITDEQQPYVVTSWKRKGLTISYSLKPIAYKLPEVATPQLEIKWKFINPLNTDIFSESTELNAKCEYGYNIQLQVRGKWSNEPGKDNPVKASGLLPLTNMDEWSEWKTIDFDKESINLNSEINLQWTLISAQDAEASINVSLKGVCSFYYGYSLTREISNNIINDCNLIGASFNKDGLQQEFKFNALDNQYCIIAYPDELGQLTSIEDNMHTDMLDIWTSGTIDVTNSRTGGVQIYRYYISDNRGAYKNVTIKTR